MNFNESGVFLKQKIKVVNLLPEIGIDQARKEIISGLNTTNPYISSKYFYDQKGSELFVEITELKEYYPTRTEKEILRNISSEIMNRKDAFEIIELGSGDCSKISILLDAVNKSSLKEIKYIPVDFSASAVEKSAADLSDRFPELEINGYVADFFHQLDQIPHTDQSRLVCFLGSTIGNFNLPEAKQIIQNLAKSIIVGDSLLIGFDLLKSKKILNEAYNDSKQITKKFNKNILKVVNGIIESNFRQDDFDHYARFVNEKNRIEMHLIANKECEVSTPFTRQAYVFKKGDSLHTENSHKFTMDTIRELVEGSSLEIDNVFTDPQNWFALVEFGKKI